MLKTLATVIYPALVQQTNALADAQARLDSSNDLSAGFRKLLESKDSQGERGGTTYAAAYDILNNLLDLIQQANAKPSNTALQFTAANAEIKTQDYFRRVFPELGDVRDLLKDLALFRKREADAASRSESGFSPAGEVRLTDAIEKTVAQSTGSVAVRLGGYLLNLQDEIRKLQAEREAIERERRAGASQPVTGSTRTPKPPPPPPQNPNFLLKMGGGA